MENKTSKEVLDIIRNNKNILLTQGGNVALDKDNDGYYILVIHTIELDDNFPSEIEGIRIKTEYRKAWKVHSL